MSAAIIDYEILLEQQTAEYERQSSAEFDAKVQTGSIDPRAGRRSLLGGAMTAAELDAMVLPPTEYAIPGLIPEGASMIVSAPKIGKSWMVLGIAQAIAEGGTVFGSIPVQKRPVLYLALEDGWKRLQARRRKLGGVAPEGLTFLPTLEGDARETIQEFLDLHRDSAPVVIVDTLQKIRGVYGGADKYAKDYEDVGSLKDLADACPGSSLIIVHHTRKAGDGDFLDSVSGTQGIAGALDAILAIRRTRGSEDSTLYVTARDAAEGEYAMRMCDGTWTLKGGSLEAAAQAARQGEMAQGLGDQSQRILAAVADAPNGITPSGIAKVVADCDNRKAATYLGRLLEAGKILKGERGKYFPLPAGESLPDLEHAA
ncbi:AAA family ATPase [Brachybacterium paraconglomeratum]